MRLIIQPADLDSIQRSDGSIDWGLVEEVVVVEITDTHG